ncbi:MAG: hypothetical protein NPIRA06_07720 [Nitrospirales bacterium]|nr:MAG: hypothetical protein NPIRA06_07720 [Nitrospirales bacterium]
MYALPGTRSGQGIPDAKPLGLFREPSAPADVVEALVEQWDAYLPDQGLQPRGGQRIDAAMVPVPNQEHSREETAAMKAHKNPPAWETHPPPRRQNEVVERWLSTQGDNHPG